MKIHRWTVACVVIVACVEEEKPPPVIEKVLPVISSLVPAAFDTGSPGGGLRIVGTGFVRNALVQLDGTPRTSRFTSATELSVDLTPGDLAVAGEHLITVTTQPPFGGTSVAVTLAVVNPAPVVNVLSPTSIPVGSGPTTLRVEGTGFVSASTAFLDDVAVPTTRVSRTELSLALPAEAFTAAREGALVVKNPVPGGGSSPPKTLSIERPVPTVTALDPPFVARGAAAFTLAIDGAGFDAASVVRWNGADAPTSFVSPTRVTIAVSEATTALPAVAKVTVFSAAPGGGASNEASFEIRNPAPAISATHPISPAQIPAGSPAQTFTIHGAGFVPETALELFQTLRSVTLIDATRLSFELSAAELEVGAEVVLAVRNAAPGGGFAETTFASVFNPAPVITSLAPSGSPANGAAFTLAVIGSGFNSGTIVRWNGNERTVTKLDSGRLEVPIPTSDLAAGATATVSVSNGPPGGGTAEATFTLIGGTRVLERLSVQNHGEEIPGVSSSARLSGDGRVAVFTNDGGPAAPLGDVFVRNACTAGGDCSKSTVRATHPVFGFSGVPNGASGAGAPNETGRFVAFQSAATNLLQSDSDFVDVLVKDTCLGATACSPSTKLVSAASDGTPANHHSSRPSIDGAGRRIAFESSATNLDARFAGTPSGGRVGIFVRDTCSGASGCAPSTELVSVTDAGVPATTQALFPAISANGRFVAFCSTAENLAPGAADNNTRDIFVRDTCFGASSCAPSTRLVSVETADGAVACDTADVQPSISADGRYIAFAAPSTPSGPSQIWVRDTCAGASGCTPATTCASVRPSGTASAGRSTEPSLSATGRFVAFTSDAGDLVDVDGNGVRDVFVRDTCAGAPSGCVPTTVLASTRPDGVQGTLASFGGTLSGDGRWAAFLTAAPNLAARDTNAKVDVVLAPTGF